MKRSIVLEHEYPHPPSLVWRALTEPDLLERWLMPNDFTPEVGAEFRFTSDPQPGWDGVVHCRVLEVEREQRLRYTWVGGPLDTEIAMTLTPTPSGTRLRVEHTGFEGFNATLVSFILQAGSRRMYRKTLAGKCSMPSREARRRARRSRSATKRGSGACSWRCSHRFSNVRALSASSGARSGDQFIPARLRSHLRIRTTHVSTHDRARSAGGSWTPCLRTGLVKRLSQNGNR